MAKWIFTRPGSWDYPTLGFRATTGDVCEADQAPDAWWDATDSGATVTVPIVPTAGIQEDLDGAVLVYNATTNKDERKLPAAAGLLTEASADSRYGRVGGVNAAPLTMLSVDAATSEWWIGNEPRFLAEPRPRMLTAHYSEDGDALVTETPLSGAASRTIVASAHQAGVDIDDHDTPTLYAEDGYPAVLAWTNHGDNPEIFMKIAAHDAEIEDFAAASLVTTADVVTGGTTWVSNYAQVFRIPSLTTATEAYYWLFTRSGDRWQIHAFTVNRTTLAYTFVHRMNLGVIGGKQTYTTVSEWWDGDAQKFTWASYVNPSDTIHALWMGDIDVDTLAYTPRDGATFTLNTDLATRPVLWSSTSGYVTTPTIAEFGDALHSRRLFYVRRDAILYADWTISDPAGTGRYYLAEIDTDGTILATHDLGPTGAKFGYTDASNYIAGACFGDWDGMGEVFVARNVGGASRIERRWVGRDGVEHWQTVAKAEPGEVFARPVHIAPGLLAFSIIRDYGMSLSFDFEADVRTVTYTSGSLGSEVVTAREAATLGELAPMRSGAYYAPAAGAISTSVITEGSFRGAIMSVGRDCTIDTIAFEVTTAGSTGSVVRPAVYRITNFATMTVELVVDGGAVDGTTTGVKTVTVSAPVYRGDVLVVGAAQQGTPSTRSTCRAQTGSTQAVGSATAATILSGSLAGVTFTASGAMPDTAVATSEVGGAVPRVAIRAA